jgi:hypothetical protein
MADLGGGPSVVTSRRHGNVFPLVNSALLQQARIIGRARESVEDETDVYRPTILHLTYITPNRDRPTVLRTANWVRIILGVEISALLVIAAVLYRNDLLTGAIALACMALGLFLLGLLQERTSLNFANKLAIAKDAERTAAQGAATDVHLVAEHWNATELDVLIGYSSHLHALTNIAVRIHGRRTLRWIARALLVVLAAQAAALASLASRADEQAPASLIWLACYLLLQVPARLYPGRLEALLAGLPATVRRIPPLVFSARRTALAFVGALPMAEPRAGHWDWLDGFMPPNQRRQQLENLSVTARLMAGAGDIEIGSTLDEREQVMMREIQAVLADPAYRNASAAFLTEVGLPSKAFSSKY